LVIAGCAIAGFRVFPKWTTIRTLFVKHRDDVPSLFRIAYDTPKKSQAKTCPASCCTIKM
ncbi:hypothetical protein, partial [Vibrio anguillarum]